RARERAARVGDRARRRIANAGRDRGGRRCVRQMGPRSRREGGGGAVITLVGTPIGNLGDLSPRVASALADADIVAAEDTRRARTLLSHLGLRKKLVSYHRANERQRGPDLISAAQSGQRVVLVSD